MPPFEDKFRTWGAICGVWFVNIRPWTSSEIRLTIYTSLGRISLENVWSYWAGCWFSKAWGLYKFVHAVRTQWKIAVNPKATEPYLSSSSLCIRTQYTRHSNEMETWQHHAYTGCFGCDHYMTLLAWWLVIHAGNKHIVANSLETGGSGCWDFFLFWCEWSYSCSEICDWTVSLQVESFIKKENLENVHFGGPIMNSRENEFQQIYMHWSLSQKWQTTGSVCGGWRQSKRYMLTEGKLQDVQEAWLEVCALHTQLVSLLWSVVMARKLI